MVSVRRFMCCTVLISLLALKITSTAAKDFIITIAGGYDPSGNQASLEANVLFFQQIIRDQHQGEQTHQIYFADGFDAAADVQEQQDGEVKASPAKEFIASLHRARLDTIEYRNHRVPDISGALEPKLVRAEFERIAGEAGSGDRLLVYVTAHGSEGKGDDRFNTTINCWDNESVSMREFSRWLDQISSDVPVILVMAQCYCGGFSHTIFTDGDPEKGLSKQLRVGFFAQQHDLAAAGCRPDIKNDEEFSSYFWGALVAASRTGSPMRGCDANSDGTVSFSEAYAQAVVASETIDIPLRASDALLRTHSRIPDYSFFPNKPRRERRPPDRERPAAEQTTPSPDSESGSVTASPDRTSAVSDGDTATPIPVLHPMAGSLESFIANENAPTRRIVEELSRQLGCAMQDDVVSVLDAYREQLRSGLAIGRGVGRRNSSGRRELLEQVGKKWPELAEPDKWNNAAILKDDDQTALMEAFRGLEGFDTYQQRRIDREEQAKQSEQRELKSVKFRRLIDTLEVIVLARNLPLVATPEIATRYLEMLRLEQTTLSPAAVKNSNF